MYYLIRNNVVNKKKILEAFCLFSIQKKKLITINKSDVLFAFRFDLFLQNKRKKM